MSKTPNHPSPDNDFGLPRTDFKPLRQESNGMGIALFILTLLIAGGAGAAYWYFYTASENELLKEVDIAFSAEPTEEETNDKPIGESSEVSQNDTPLPQEEKNDFVPTPPTRGTLTQLKRPQGKYYVVVNCFIDADLAMDHANALVKQGKQVILISPLKGDYFSCVAVAEGDTLYEANKKAQALKANYGNDVWVKKY